MSANSSQPQRVLFVCLGNICRSPTAHGVFRDYVEREDLRESIVVDSAGTGDWHVGSSPDRRAAQAALQRGFNLSDLIARQVSAKDFDRFDYILAMDRANLNDLELLRPSHFAGHLGLFLEFADGAAVDEVPDPYYGGDKGFEQVLDLVEAASLGLLDHIKRSHF